MYILINSIGLVVESSITPIAADLSADCFISPRYRHYDPRPSSGIAVIEADFPAESFCEYRMINGVPVLINAPAAPAAPAVPEFVPMLNAKLALYAAGWLADVDALFAGMEGAAGDLARIYWATALTVRRDNEFVSLALAHLGKTEDEGDALFIAADALVIP